MNFLNGMTLLLVYQLVGEVTVRLLAVPIPGPVLGMVMLFLTLMIRGRTPEPLQNASTALLSHLSLLFVPAGVGMMAHFDRIADEWLPITLALFFSTIITMIATAGIMQVTTRWFARPERGEGKRMNEPAIRDIWVYLSASPLLGLTITLVAYGLAYRLYLKSNSSPLANPVVTSVAMLIALLMVTGTSYDEYFEGGQFVHFLLGPATVALAVPLYQQFSRLRQLWLPVTISLVCGVAIAAGSSIGLAWLLGGSTEIQMSLAPKSATAPVAMGISETIGGIPSLTAVLVVATGIVGAVLGTKLFEWMRITDDSVKGIAMGVAAHGIGTARAFQVSSQMGAFSGLAMALSAFATALLVPWLVDLIGI